MIHSRLNCAFRRTRRRKLQVLVQNWKTRVFYRGGTAWTEDAAQAHDFRSPNAAERFCKENGLVRVRLILRLVKPTPEGRLR